MVLDDEATVPQDLPSGPVPFKLVDEHESVSLEISEDEDIDHSGNPSSSPIDRLSAQEFEGEDDFCPYFQKATPCCPSNEPRGSCVNPSISSATTTVVAFITTHVATPREEAGPSSRRRGIKHVLIEVPNSGNLLNKSSRVVVWLKPLIVLEEREKLESHSSKT